MSSLSSSSRLSRSLGSSGSPESRRTSSGQDNSSPSGRRQQHVPFVLFHTFESHPGTYFLSNFYPHGFNGRSGLSLDLVYDGVIWTTSEHLYQALKFRCESPIDREWREVIRAASTPYKSKYLGNLRTDTRYPWMRELADLVLRYRPYIQYADIGDRASKTQRMLTVLRIKFSDPELRQLLLDTEDGRLSEDSNDEWGWRNGNLLGDCLMIVRDEIQAEIRVHAHNDEMYRLAYEQQVRKLEHAQDAIFQYENGSGSTVNSTGSTANGKSSGGNGSIIQDGSGSIESVQLSIKYYN